jgi:YesN/AraC family two-component response regulator
MAPVLGTQCKEPLFTKIEQTVPATFSSTMNMNPQTLSRQYLQGLPEAQRRQMIENDVFRLFQQIAQPLQNAALKGEARYLHDMSQWMAQQQGELLRQHQQRVAQTANFSKAEAQLLQQKGPAPPEPPSDELLAGLAPQLVGLG